MTGFFSSYIQSIACVGICAFICEWICSTGRSGDNIRKTVSLVASLCIAITVLLPFCSGMNDIFEGLRLNKMTEADEKSDSTKAAFYDLTEKETENSIFEEINTEFGIKPLSVSIDLNEHEGVMEADNVTVTVCRQDEECVQKINTFLCEQGFKSISVTCEDEENETFQG